MLNLLFNFKLIFICIAKPLIRKKKVNRRSNAKQSDNNFFITSVDDDPEKENVEANKDSQQSEVNKEAEKPMFESINKNTKYGTFNYNSKKMSSRKNRAMHSNNRKTNQNSKLPSVMRNGHKTSLDFVHCRQPSDKRSAKNLGFKRNYGSRTSRNHHCKILFSYFLFNNFI